MSIDLGGNVLRLIFYDLACVFAKVSVCALAVEPKNCVTLQNVAEKV